MARDETRAAKGLRAAFDIPVLRVGALSGAGLALGLLFFAASLTPTLAPRTFLTQGVLGGACFAAGYGFGALGDWLWSYLELSRPGDRVRRAIRWIVLTPCLVVAIVFLWRSAAWQDSIRVLMEMESVAGSHPARVCAVAIATAIALLGLARLFGFVLRFVAEHARRLVPRRIANVIGVVVAALLFWSLASGVFFQGALRVLDASFSEYDALLEPERPQPTDPLRSGSAASMVGWRELGRAGREFIASGPGAADISAFTGRPALEPIRVYAGLGAAETPAARARLVVEELKRVNGFDRSTLVLITPTGTGWIDPAALDTLEYLREGDVASVAMQYSYLSSPLSLLVQPEYGAQAARALFSELYAYWTSLPRERRPRLYLHGLSLGALNSERSVQLFEMIGDPVDGALWSGPPFASRGWRRFVEARNPGSPAWLPEFRDGSFVRFMNQHGSNVPEQAPWGPMRIVYLQYASDAITFFDHRDLYRRPEWLGPERGPDVSPELRWYPLVTMLQLALDMAVATSTPMGYGHVFAPEHYVDAWVALTGVEGWSVDEITELKRHLARESRQKASDESNEGAYDNRGG